MVQSYKVKKVKQEKRKLKDILKKYKIILIIGLIILVILSSSGFTVWYKEYNKPSNKLKRYLISNNYECGKSTCHKEVDNVTYTVSYKKDSYQVLNETYTLNISKKTPYIVIKGKTETCSYEKEDYESLRLIDDTFIYDKDCEKYIEDINKSIKDYKDILDKSKVDISEL